MSLTDPIEPHGPILLDDDPVEATADRILDAALARFSANEIEATTMSQIAADAGISRVWLYRYFENRDAVVRALVRREALRFLADLSARDYWSAPVEEVVIDSFDEIVGILRSRMFLQRVLRSDPDVVAPFLSSSGPAVRVAAGAAATYLRQRTALSATEARAVAEAIMRIVISVVVNNDSAIDFDDRRQRRAFARVVIPRLLAPRPR